MNKRTLLFWLTIISLAFIPNLTSNAQKTGQAGLVVEFGDGSVESICISFDGDSLSGIELLERSGLDMQANYSPLGAAVCKIGTIGCPADDSCLKCQEPLFWSYWRLINNEWVYSARGASVSEVRDGDVDAWVWGYGVEPQPASFDDICIKSEATTPTHTSTNTPLATSTPQVTGTPIPTYTSVPALAAMITNTQILPPSNTAIPIPSSTPAPVLFISETSADGSTIGTATATLMQNNLGQGTITPIIVRSIPTEQDQSIPSKANLPKKAAPDNAASKELTQPTPTPLPTNDSTIGSVISDILMTVQSLVNVLLP